MLTRRGWWFLMALVGLLILGVLVPFVGLAVVALGLLIWFFSEWVAFAIRVRLVVPKLRVVREVRDERGRVDTLWAGRKFRVHFALDSQAELGLPYFVMKDFLPFGVEHVSGPTQIESSLDAEEYIEASYRIRCPSAGHVRFEGVSVQVADLQGFFYYRTFVSYPKGYRILPPLLDRKGMASTRKKHNVLPPPGIHRLRRPGTGSELLNLRDYLAGDPPKTIAWKVSARRDRLITKEYESEVPVRCTVFLDTSQAVRLGPADQSLLLPMVELTAIVIQANTRSRDLTGLCLFDEHAADFTAPARNAAHVSHVLNVLADTAALTPRSEDAPSEALLNLSHAYAGEVYPNLLHSRNNKIPLLLPWLGSDGPTKGFSGCMGLVWRVVYYFVALLVFVSQSLLYFRVLEITERHMAENKELSQYIAKPPPEFHYVLLGIAAIYYIRFANGLRRALPQIFSVRRRNLIRRRKRLAALLSAEHGLAPGGAAMLLEDDKMLSRHLQQFLGEHRVPYGLPLYDDRGRYQFSAPTKLETLAKAILHSVRMGHDNELFILAVDLLELEDHLEPLLRAVSVALARQHQVMLILPLPVGFRLDDLPVALDPSLAEERQAVVGLALRERLQRSYRKAAKAFSRKGVAVLRADSKQSVRLILTRMEQIRIAGRR
ncbi:MAG: DUF58 domain-containing protein [Gemmataceae bacterium]